MKPAWTETNWFASVLFVGAIAVSMLMAWGGDLALRIANVLSAGLMAAGGAGQLIANAKRNR